MDILKSSVNLFNLLNIRQIYNLTFIDSELENAQLKKAKEVI